MTRSRRRSRSESTGSTLQTTLAHAVMWSKGFAAKETEAALAQAGELACEIRRLFGEIGRRPRLSGPSSFRAAKCALTRERASTMLREAESAGHRMEASIARRGLAS